LSKNYFNSLVKAGAIKVKKIVPEWAKEVLLVEIQCLTKLRKLDLLLSVLEQHFSKKFERKALREVME